MDADAIGILQLTVVVGLYAGMLLFKSLGHLL